MVAVVVGAPNESEGGCWLNVFCPNVFAGLLNRLAALFCAPNAGDADVLAVDAMPNNLVNCSCEAGVVTFICPRREAVGRCCCPNAIFNQSK